MSDRQGVRALERGWRKALKGEVHRLFARADLAPEHLLDEPRNMFVARFIGSPPMNLIHGRLAMDGGEYQVDADGVRLPLPCAWQLVLDRYAKREVVLGIRPDRLAMSSAGVGAEAGDSMRTV